MKKWVHKKKSKDLP